MDLGRHRVNVWEAALAAFGIVVFGLHVASMTAGAYFMHTLGVKECAYYDAVWLLVTGAVVTAFPFVAAGFAQYTEDPTPKILTIAWLLFTVIEVMGGTTLFFWAPRDDCAYWRLWDVSLALWCVDALAWLMLSVGVFVPMILGSVSRESGYRLVFKDETIARYQAVPREYDPNRV